MKLHFYDTMNIECIGWFYTKEELCAKIGSWGSWGYIGRLVGILDELDKAANEGFRKLNNDYVWVDGAETRYFLIPTSNECKPKIGQIVSWDDVFGCIPS